MTVSFGQKPITSSINIEKDLNKMPAKDKKKIDTLFHRLVGKNEFGYALFGDKPLSLSDGSLAENLKKGWKIWSKYDDKFTSDNFTMRQTPCDSYAETIIINKKAFIDKVNQHIDLFKKLLGPDITAKKMLHSAEDPNTTLDDLISDNTGKRRDDILGILLGFGEKNSRLFQRMEDLTDHMDHVVVDDGQKYPRIAKEDMKPSKGFSSTQEELDDIVRQFGLEDQVYPNVVLDWNAPPAPPYPKEVELPKFFQISDDPETIELQKKYKEQQKDIQKIYDNKRFLSLVLKKLTDKN